EDRALGNTHLDQVIETIVEQNRRIIETDGQGAEEDLEHLFVDIEVDRGRSLRVGTLEVEDRLVPFPPQRATQGVWSQSGTVITDIVFELLTLLRHHPGDDLAHGPVGTVEHFLLGTVEGVIAEAL